MGNKNLFSIMPSSQFGVGGDSCRTKIIKLNSNEQPPQTTVVIKSNSASSGDITVKLPASDGTLALEGTATGPSFGTVQCPAGTSPVATGAGDILTLLEGSGIDITGNAITDSVTFALDPTELGASGSQSGFLSSTDWVTFNNKQPSLSFGNFTSPTDAVTLTNGTGSVIGTGTTISVRSVTVAQSGILSSTDFTAFSNKALSTDIQIFTSSGTWTKPSGAIYTWAALVAGGAGGGSGRRGATLTIRCGGGGGQGGGFTTSNFASGALGATETVLVGAGGSGGAAIAVDDTDGAVGTGGGNSTFGNWIRVTGGGAGGGGTATTGAAGTGAGFGFPPNASNTNGGTGGAASGVGGVGGTGGLSAYAASGGGSGGGITSVNGPNAGGNGGAIGAANAAGFVNGVVLGGTGGTTNNNGAPGGDNTVNVAIGGGGGGGGGGSITTNGGSGASGGRYGAGGGGGGASLNATGNSGAGGSGSSGIVIIVTVR